MNQIELNTVLYTTKNKAFHVCEAAVDGVPCYCIINDRTGCRVLISHDENIMKALIQKINRCGISCETKSSGCGFLFKFSNKGRDKSISLRSYLAAKYNRISLESIRGKKISILNTELFLENVLDMRKENLFFPGGQRTERLDIISRPDKEDEKYIIVDDGERVEIQDYSPELYDLMTARNLCGGYRANPRNGRLNIVVHFKKGKDGYMLTNLSRFILIFYQHFGKYIKQSGAGKRFVHDIKKLNKNIGENIDCGHVNGDSWNNCVHNIMPMARSANVEMGRLIQFFRGDYSAFAVTDVIDGKNMVLIELCSAGKQKYYLCQNEFDYLDLQKVLLGKTSMLKHLQMTEFNDNAARKINTPKEALEEFGKPEKEQFSLDLFWKWCDKRDNLLTQYSSNPEKFIVWEKEGEKGMSIEGVVNKVFPVLLSRYLTQME